MSDALLAPLTPLEDLRHIVGDLPTDTHPTWHFGLDGGDLILAITPTWPAWGDDPILFRGLANIHHAGFRSDLAFEVVEAGDAQRRLRVGGISGADAFAADRDRIHRALAVTLASIEPWLRSRGRCLYCGHLLRSPQSKVRGVSDRCRAGGDSPVVRLFGREAVLAALGGKEDR